MSLKRRISYRPTRIINRNKKDMKSRNIPTLPYHQAKEQTIQSILQEFVDHTTLLGVQHCVRKKSLLWLLAYLCCIIMSIVQTWDTAINFFQEKSRQTYLIGNKRSLPFPSVTVCSNVVLPDDFNYSQIPYYDMSVDDPSHDVCNRTDTEEEQWELRKQNNTEKIVKFLRNLPEEKRKNYSLFREDIVISCSYGGTTCNKSYIYDFNNPFFGNCFTFNPAFEKKQAIVGDLHDRLKLMMKLKSGIQLGGMKRTFGVLIHSPGTAPILDLPSVQDIAGGYNTDLALTIGERNFIPKQRKKNAHPTCVDEMDNAYRKRSRFYNETSPYRYSVEACMRSCEQDNIGRQCNLTLASLPFLNATYEETVNVSFPMNCPLDDLDMEVCGCPLPCKLVKYVINSDTTDILLPDCDLQGGSLNTKQQKVRVGVYFLTNIYESINEELQYTLSEFLGFLGGNMSLWIGLCILSILEIFELVYKLIGVWLRKKKNRKISSCDNTIVRKNIFHSTSTTTKYAVNSTRNPIIIR